MRLWPRDLGSGVWHGHGVGEAGLVPIGVWNSSLESSRAVAIGMAGVMV